MPVTSLLLSFSTGSQVLCKSLSVISAIGDLISDYKHHYLITSKVFL